MLLKSVVVVTQFEDEIAITVVRAAFNVSGRQIDHWSIHGISHLADQWVQVQRTVGSSSQTGLNGSLEYSCWTVSLYCQKTSDSLWVKMSKTAALDTFTIQTLHVHVLCVWLVAILKRGQPAFKGRRVPP